MGDSHPEDLEAYHEETKEFEDLYNLKDIPDIPQPPWADQLGERTFFL